MPAIRLEQELHTYLQPSRGQEAAPDVAAGRCSGSRQNALVGVVVQKVQSIEKQSESGILSDGELLLNPDIQQVPWIHRTATVPHLRIDGGGDPQVGNPDLALIGSAAKTGVADGRENVPRKPVEELRLEHPSSFSGEAPVDVDEVVGILTEIRKQQRRSLAPSRAGSARGQYARCVRVG